MAGNILQNCGMLYHNQETDIDTIKIQNTHHHKDCGPL